MSLFSSEIGLIWRLTRLVGRGGPSDVWSIDRNELVSKVLEDRLETRRDDLKIRGDPEGKRERFRLRTSTSRFERREVVKVVRE